MKKIDFQEAAQLLRSSLGERRHTPILASELGSVHARRAAVMILVLSRPEGPTILFIQRTQEVSKHKGEIAFPGGGLEKRESFIDAALRETQEEIGIRIGNLAIR